ncbi:hypothetical protein INR49_017759 [Caranx melampygus]|nr:hypothetical protein INR49_017759 [Caranx melampygus]
MPFSSIGLLCFNFPLCCSALLSLLQLSVSGSRAPPQPFLPHVFTSLPSDSGALFFILPVSACHEHHAAGDLSSRVWKR